MLARTPQECDALREANINSGNLEGLLALYEPGACLVQQKGEPHRTGAALQQSLAAYIPLQANIKTNVTQVISAGDDLALIYNDWTLTAGGMSLSGKAVEIVRRQPDGTWKFVVDDPFGRT